MKKTFQEFYKPEDEKLAKLWKECLFAFDASVLLALYEYTKNTAEEILEAMDRWRSRIWLPYRAGYEYHLRRVPCIQERLSAHKKAREEVENLCKELRQVLDTPDNKALGKEDIVTTVDEFEDDILGKINETRERTPEMLKEDPILKQLSDLFADRVGDPFPDEKRSDILEEASERYPAEIPPGFKDVDNLENLDDPDMSEIGDLLIWKQLIRKAKTKGTPIVFITNDQKEDWWHIAKHNRKVGPHYALRREFLEETGQEFYIYRPTQFVKHTEQHAKGKVNKQALEEMKHLESAEDRRRSLRKRRVTTRSEAATLKTRSILRELEEQVANCESRLERLLQERQQLKHHRNRLSHVFEDGPRESNERFKNRIKSLDVKRHKIEEEIARERSRLDRIRGRMDALRRDHLDLPLFGEPPTEE